MKRRAIFLPLFFFLMSGLAALYAQNGPEILGEEPPAPRRTPPPAAATPAPAPVSTPAPTASPPAAAPTAAPVPAPAAPAPAAPVSAPTVSPAPAPVSAPEASAAVSPAPVPEASAAGSPAPAPDASAEAPPEAEIPEDGKPAVALVPFWGTDESIIAQFGEALRQSLENGGEYLPEPVDMEHLPEDVPEGGFPPYVCPSPSLTKEAPYALTGEVVLDDSGLYHLRLYLWEMANVRLLYTDEIAVQDREECAQYLPPTLEWLFSWVPGNRETAGPPAAEAESYRPFPEAPPEYWLYFGLKAGSSLRFYYRPADKVFVEDDVAHFFNVSAGLHLSFYFLSFLGVQAEALFTSDYAPYKAIDLEGTGQSSALRVYHDAQFISQSLMFPLTLHFTLRKTSFFASALGGVYLIVPLGEMRNRYFGGNFAWSVDPPLGYTAGINLGTKAGPGNLFLDLRWSQDLALSRKNSGETIYRRSAVSIAVGYELGFFRKHR